MYPEEEWPLRVARQPVRGASHDLRCGPINGSETFCPRSRRLKSGVVQRKATVEAGRQSILRIQCDGTDKGGRVISARPEQIWKEGQSRRQLRAKLAGPVRLRISAGEDGRVRDHGQRRLRISLLENHALAGQAIEVRSEFRL